MRHIDQSHMVKNSWIMVDFQLVLLTKRGIHVAQILQGLSYKTYFITSPNFFAFGLFILFLETAIIHQQLAAMLRGHARLFCTPKF